MAVYVGGKKIQETGGKYQSKGIPDKGPSRKYETVGSRQTGFTRQRVPEKKKWSGDIGTPEGQFESLRLQKDKLQHIPYTGDDSGRNMYQMGIQNLLGRGDQYKKAYLQKYPIGGRINLGVPAAFNAIMSKVVPGVSSIANMFGNRMSGVGQGIKNVFSGPSEALGFHGNKFMQDLSRAPSGFFNNLQSMLGINKSQNLPDIKTTQTKEDIVSPAALSRTDSVVPPQFLELYNQVPEQTPQYPLMIPEEYKKRQLLQQELHENMFNQMDPFLQPEIPFLDRGAPVKFAHGGEIQDDAYARLKAINDSMHEM